MGMPVNSCRFKNRLMLDIEKYGEGHVSRFDPVSVEEFERQFRNAFATKNPRDIIHYGIYHNPSGREPICIIRAEQHPQGESGVLAWAFYWKSDFLRDFVSY